jgi:D-inositol-3-phosphate glycosyltransferase
MHDEAQGDGLGPRPEILLITNHGYAGAEIPIGGAPDTGGQVVYVNALARALAEIGYEVTILSRGGFAGHGDGPLREGAEALGAHARYLFVPGGGSRFIPKEDIAVALDEEVAWIEQHVRERAARRGVRPWEVYELINTHYWDAAVIGEQLVAGWRREAGDASDRHVWTPHSLGAIKERNYRDKPLEVRRALRFCERRSHERMICGRTRAFASTSPEITRSLTADFGVEPGRIVDFPPCVDTTCFRAYPEDDLDVAYDYLAAHSELEPARLRAGRLVFEASRNDETKRKDLLVDAFVRGCGELGETFLVIGGGPDNGVQRELERRRESDPALRERLILLRGRIPDPVLHRLFSLADLYVTPSEMEGFGMSAAQAAAAGTALITSDLVPFATGFVPEHAVVVPAGDTAGFATAIRRLLEDGGERGARGRALADATAGLAWVPVARRFLDQLRARGLPIAAPRPRV